MQERTSQILRYIIEDYIDSASPVGSSILVRKYNIPASAATVRIEMVTLSDEGYLNQPHTSSGRIPTEQAYRFFVDTILAQYSANMRLNVARKLINALSLELLAHLREDAEQSTEASLQIGGDTVMFSPSVVERHSNHINLLRDLQNLLEN